jgi:hypothetical protein
MGRTRNERGLNFDLDEHRNFPGESEGDRETHAVDEAVRLALAFVAFAYKKKA